MWRTIWSSKGGTMIEYGLKQFILELGNKEFIQELEELENFAKLGMAIEFIRVHIDESGYTYNSVSDIIQGYHKRLNNYYNSYTMNIMIDDCEESLKILYPYWYRKEVTNDK